MLLCTYVFELLYQEMHEDGTCELKRVAHYYIPLKCRVGRCIACVRDIEKTRRDVSE